MGKVCPTPRASASERTVGVGPCLHDLPTHAADHLAQALTRHVEDCGGQIATSDIEIARECVRRARRAEQAERAAQELAERMHRYTG